MDEYITAVSGFENVHERIALTLVKIKSMKFSMMTSRLIHCCIKYENCELIRVIVKFPKFLMVLQMMLTIMPCMEKYPKRFFTEIIAYGFHDNGNGEWQHSDIKNIIKNMETSKSDADNYAKLVFLGSIRTFTKLQIVLAEAALADYMIKISYKKYLKYMKKIAYKQYWST